MTVEELQAQLAATTQALEAEKARASKLEENQSQQNSYITKLEQQTKQLENSIKTIEQATKAPAVDMGNQDLVKYFRKKMREDIMEDGIHKIKARSGDAVYAVLEKEFMEFINTSMNEENQSVEYMSDAFALIRGRALDNPDHPINAIGRPAATAPTVDATAIRNMRPTAPVMTSGDASASHGMAQAAAPQVRNTKEAMASLKERFIQAGANRFQ